MFKPIKGYNKIYFLLLEIRNTHVYIMSVDKIICCIQHVYQYNYTENRRC